MKPEERWALVHYVQSLRRTDVAVNDLLAPEDSAIRVQKVAKLPTDPMDHVLGIARPGARAAQSALARAEPGLRGGGFRRDGRQDSSPCCSSGAMSCRRTPPSACRIFRTARRCSFRSPANTASSGMGDKDNPVNLWQWKAGWQAEADGGSAPDMDAVYPSMHVDAWTFTELQHRRQRGQRDLAAAQVAGRGCQRARLRLVQIAAARAAERRRARASGTTASGT